MNTVRSTNHGAPPRWTVVLSDELAPVFSAALSQRGLHTLTLSNVAPVNGTPGVAERATRAALIAVSSDPCEAIATLFSLRRTFGTSLAAIAMVPARRTDVEPLLLRAGFLHCLRGPQAGADVCSMVIAAADSLANAQPAARTGLLREARFVLQTHAEAHALARLLAEMCPDPMRQQLGIEEILLNAVEHGNLGITGEEKARILLSGEDWHAELAKRLGLPQNVGKRVQVFWRHQADEISLSVVDEGEGFDHEAWARPRPEGNVAPNGRGIALARALAFDSLHFEGRGNHVVARFAQTAVIASEPEATHPYDATAAAESGGKAFGIAAQLDDLLRLNLAAKQDQDMALRVVGNILANSQLDHPAVRWIQAPLERFSGDVLLVHPLPSGGLRIFLGDFAGHGLSAAIGTIPLASIFFATVRKGVPLAESIATINQRLHEIMPPSMFCAATMLEVDETWSQAQLFTAGMPPVLLNHTRTGRTTSWETKELPLGILPSGQLAFPLLPISLEQGDRLYIYSDGVTEQRNPQEELFGQARLEQVISSLQPGSNVTQVLREQIGKFKGHQAASDDLTLLELTIVAPKSDISRAHESGIWAAMPEKTS